MNTLPDVICAIPLNAPAREFALTPDDINEMGYVPHGHSNLTHNSNCTWERISMNGPNDEELIYDALLAGHVYR